MTWLAHVLGLDNGSGYWYLFYSGVGANFGELAIVGSLIAIARRHNCHVHRCWRVGRFPVAETSFIVCRRHHPDVPDEISAEHIAEVHAEAVDTTSSVGTVSETATSRREGDPHRDIRS